MLQTTNNGLTNNWSDEEIARAKSEVCADELRSDYENLLGFYYHKNVNFLIALTKGEREFYDLLDLIYEDYQFEVSERTNALLFSSDTRASKKEVTEFVEISAFQKMERRGLRLFVDALQLIRDERELYDLYCNPERE